jgi:hypothetical protein
MSLKRVIVVNVALLALVGVTLSGCGGGEETPPAASGGSGGGGGGGGGTSKCGTCTEPDASVNLMMPVVSFKTDIMEPIFRTTCNSITCHGVAPAMATPLYPGAGLYLGPPVSSPAPDAATVTSIVTALKGQSKTAPTMKIVEAGNEALSFLIAKIHGCENDRALACTQQSAMLIRCTTSPCGDVMPPVGEPLALTADQKNTIRRWVAQGALDN